MGLMTDCHGFVPAKGAHKWLSLCWTLCMLAVLAAFKCCPVHFRLWLLRKLA